MNTFPVIERELRIRARQGSTYWARYGAAGIGMIFVLHFASGFGTRAGSASGSATFTALSWVTLLAACGSFAVTADAISSERREGTLGLLLLTGLHTAEFISGKLVSAALTTVFAIIGALPALALGVLWGGVTGGQIFRTGLAILAILFVGLAAGLCVSTRAITQGQAYVRASLLMAGLLFGPWLVAGILSVFGNPAYELLALSPYRCFLAAHPAVYGAAPWSFWIAVALALLEGCVLFALAGRGLRGVWSQVERPASINPESWLARLRKPKSPVIRAALQGREWLLDNDPICWLSLRLHDQSVLIWIGAILLIFSGSATPILFLGGIGAGISLFMSFVPAVIFAWAAGKFFLEARKSGELELLLATPLGGRDIVRGRWHALLIRFRGPLLLAVFILFLEFIFAATTGAVNWMLALMPLNRALDAVAVFWVAMWFGLSAKGSFAVVAWPVGLVIALPWFICYALFGQSAMGAFLMLVKNVIFIRWAAETLQHDFRAVAPLAVGNWFKQTEELVGTVNA
jgi:ABC-type transport system involved in multi-copper enzyme maturation permease subunit